MIRIRFFGPQELIQNGFRAAQYSITGESVAVAAQVAVKFTGGGAMYSTTGAGAAQDEYGADATKSVTGVGATYMV